MKINKKKFSFGATATLITVLFIAGVLLVNILVGVLADKFSLSLDLTSEKLYDFSEDSLSYIKKLNNAVTITAFTTADAVNQSDKALVGQIENIIKKYAQLSDKITYEQRDLTADPTYAQKFQKDGVTLTVFSVVVECGDRYKVLNMADMVQYDQSGSSATGLKAEQKMTSALMYVTTDNIPSFVFTTGHDEGTAQTLQNLAVDNNFTTATVNLLAEDPSEETQILVIYAPERDFSASEIERLDAFLNKGNKGLMVYLSPEQGALPVLEDYLAEWGLASGHNLVLDAKNALMYPYNIVLGYEKHDITEGLVDRNAMAIGSMTGSVDLLFTEKGNYSTYPLLISYPDAYAKSLADGPVLSSTDKEEGDKTGTFTVAAGSRKMTSGKNTVEYSNVLLFGSSEIAGDQMLQTSQFTNGQIMANSIGFLRGNSDMVNIATKYYDDTALQITNEEAGIYVIFFLYIIPLILIIAAVVVFIRRRHL